MNNTWKIYMLTLISFLVGTSQFVIVGILDQVASSVGVSVSAAGQLTTAFSLANAIGTPLVILAAAKLDRRRQLLIALCILLLGIVSTLALPGFGFLMVSRAVLGVATGVFIVTAYGTAAQLAPPGRQGGAMSNVAMGFSAALVFGVPIGRVVAGAYDWKTIFWGLGFLSLLALVAVARTTPASESEAPVSLRRQLSYLKKPKIAAALGVPFFVFIGYSAVNTYITPFLATLIPISEQGISAVLLALGIASLIGSKAGGFLTDRIGTSRTLLISMSVQVVALVLLSLFTGSVSMSVSLLMLWAIAIWSFGPTQNFNLISIAPEASSIMLSLNSSFVQLGFAAGAGIGGIAVGSSSVMAVSWIGSAAILTGLSIAAVSFGRTHTYARIE
ncbi:MFS transporter [Paenibacillus sp. 8b26]|uniref:MFS transporter n=1 Tax=Paenibacillus sp. 8b26 TaxID=3424133 RepID=UPI003D6584DB